MNHNNERKIMKTLTVGGDGPVKQSPTKPKPTPKKK
jgi:hypothetical protein